MGTTRTVDKRRLRQLERDAKKGIPLSLTQEERDLLHGEPNEENLLYWTEERNKAIAVDDIKRMRACDHVRRTMLLLTAPQVTNDCMDDVLGHTLGQFEALPREH